MMAVSPGSRRSYSCLRQKKAQPETLAAASTTPSRPAALLAVLLAVACSGPGSYEEFVRAEDAPAGIYEFALPGGAYDLSFYTAPLAEPLQLEITLDSLKETVWFPAGQHEALYRSGVRLVGAEALRVRPINPPEDFRGLGIIIKRNDGTR